MMFFLWQLRGVWMIALAGAAGHLVQRPALAEEKEITNSIGMKLVLIPAGEFQMGSPAGEEDRKNDETLHRVKITKPYYLGVYEVTQADYKQVIGTNPSRFTEVAGQDTGRFPVETVTWDEAQEFCRRCVRPLREDAVAE